MNFYKYFGIVSGSIILISSGAAYAQDIDANASAYADYETSIDSMNASYQSYFAVKDPNGADDTVYNTSFNNSGNVYQNLDSTSSAIKYTDATAA